MSSRLQFYALQGLLLIALAHVALAYVLTVTNWKAWILIVVFPYFLALISNRIFRNKNTFALPAICFGSGITLSALGMIQFFGIVTNPFHMPITPVSLAIPASAIAVTLFGCVIGYGAKANTKNKV